MVSAFTTNPLRFLLCKSTSSINKLLFHFNHNSVSPPPQQFLHEEFKHYYHHLPSLLESCLQARNLNSVSPPPQQFLHEEFKHYYHHLPSLLESCLQARNLDFTKPFHALSITLGSTLDQPIFIHNNLISAYASFGELPLSRKVFDQMPERNVVSYNSVIAAYCKHVHGYEAWVVFIQMMEFGFKPTQFTFGSLLSSSSSLDYIHGLQLHSLILKIGLIYGDAFSGTALLGFFGRFGKLDDALNLFEEMPNKNLVTWNSMISLFGQHGFVEESVALFRELLRGEVCPSEYSFLGVLSGFVESPDFFELGEQIHGLMIKNGSGFYLSVANSLMNMYVKCSGTYFAEKMFREMPFRDVVSWNIIIGAFARSETPWRAFETFLVMSWHGFSPTQTTFANVISSCIKLQVLNYGEIIHAKTIKSGFKSDVFVGSALVDFYAKCGYLVEADFFFTELDEKNVVSWNALISGYSSKGSCRSVYLLQEMLREGNKPNEFSFSAVLKISSLKELQQLHCLILRIGYHQNEYVSSSLVASYAMNGFVSDALSFTTALFQPLSSVSTNVIAGIYNRTGQYQETQKLLSHVEEHNIISWNILIAACARNRDYREVFDLFENMLMAQILPDNYTVMSLLSISTKLCNLGLGSTIHGFVIKMDFKCCDIFVCNVLLDMYAKCGSLESSIKVFNEMTERNLISWTCLISALGLHGYAFEALQRFKDMEKIGFKPDKVAFITVLSACRHGGLVEEGMELFERMLVKYGVEPDLDHYICVVDLLSRYGRLKEAERLIIGMPFQPSALILRIYLDGCQRYRNLEEQAVG